MKAETSGNSSFPYEYLILQFEKVQKYKMYLILTWPPGERVKGDFAKGVCFELSEKRACNKDYDLSYF